MCGIIIVSCQSSFYNPLTPQIRFFPPVRESFSARRKVFAIQFCVCRTVCIYSPCFIPYSSVCVYWLTGRSSLSYISHRFFSSGDLLGTTRLSRGFRNKKGAAFRSARAACHASLLCASCSSSPHRDFISSGTPGSPNLLLRLMKKDTPKEMSFFMAIR